MDGPRGLLVTLLLGSTVALLCLKVADAFSCYSCDTRNGDRDCLNSSPGKNVTCPAGTNSCFSFYNESVPTLPSLHMRGCAPAALYPETQHVCKKPEFYHCYDASSFALRASDLGSTDPLLCVCKGANCNPSEQLKCSKAVFVIGPLTALTAVFAMHLTIVRVPGV